MHVSHHLFWLVDDGQLPQPGGPPGNGLIAVTQPGAALVLTGIHTGLVRLSVEAHHTAPLDVALTGWDEVVEVSMHVPAGQLRAAATTVDNPDQFPALTARPGHHRIRVHARGRDTAVDGVATEPVEDYHIVVWPAPPAAEQIHRHTDTYGDSLRQAATRWQAPTEPPATEPPHDPNRAALDARLRQARNQR